MLDAKFMSKFGTLALVGGLLVGCTTGGDDDDATDETPSDSPSPSDETPTPEAFYFDEDTVSYDCEGSNTSTTSFTFTLTNLGWLLEDTAEVTIFDNLNAVEGNDPDNAYCEIHTLELTSGEASFDGSNGENTQTWSRELAYSTDIDDQAQDVDTVFRCGEGYATTWTYRFCAEDKYYEQSNCVLIGPENDIYDANEYLDVECTGQGATFLPSFMVRK